MPLHLRLTLFCDILLLSMIIWTREGRFKLAGKHILVFGGTSGIGFCVAEAALEEGGNVFISGSSPAKLASALKNLLEAYPTASNRLKGKTCDLSVAKS
jgi:NAD(P)-dependent dehydrogenase (short-subunit alcohol dehydrogenase family)